MFSGVCCYLPSGILLVGGEVDVRDQVVVKGRGLAL
jgi:hypothetical protein